MFNGIKSRTSNIILLSVGIFTLSLAGVLIKLANASVYGVAFYRLFIAAVVVGVISIKDVKEGFRTVDKKTFMWMLLGGVIFSFHLMLWIYGLKTVGVFEGMVVMASNPIYACLGAYFIFKEKPRSNFMLSFVIAFIGTVLIFWDGLLDFKSGFTGVLCIFISTLLFAAYVLTGKKIRTNASSGFYIFVLYLSAAAVCFIGMLITGAPIVSYSGRSYFFFILLALLPTVIGHGSLNHCVAHFRASTITILTLMEPVIGSVAAYFVLGEDLYSLAALGFIFIIIGVGLLFKSEIFSLAKRMLWN